MPPTKSGEPERALLDRLLEQSRLYHSSKEYLELLEFVRRLRNFAPFNAMLLHVQKPGLTYAASADDWRVRCGRSVKEHARPLLILWPFGPVALVYDVLDTEGPELPRDVSPFPARGPVTLADLDRFIGLLGKKAIECRPIDAGAGNAGNIRCIASPTEKKTGAYRMHLNRNQDAPAQFVTLAHELAHLLLGHLGPDKHLSIPERPRLSLEQRELEAESVAYLVSARNGVEASSETYLANYVKSHTTVDSLDLFQVMRAAGQIESLLGLASHTRYEKPPPPGDGPEELSLLPRN